MLMWQEELTSEQKQELTEKIAAKVIAKGLAVPVIAFLEMNKPISNIWSHGAIALSPFLAPFIGLDNLDKYTQFFSYPSNVEAVIRRIEELEEARITQKKEDKDATCKR